MKGKRYLTVTALTKYIKRKFDADPHLRQVHLKGEISNFKMHTSGHMYFTLKDENAKIQAVMFASYNRSLKFMPENGMNVLVTGDVTVYEPSGQYQIYVTAMQPDGIGDLYLAFEQLKEKLEKEGYFSPQHKKPIPKYPRNIGVVTSPTGAAIRDIISTIKRRYPIANILIFPALVQGEQAPKSIVKAIKRANECGEEIDVLIVGRGGGSIEELWAFNEEVVAKAIFHSQIPVISAVGHETDFTIADFVADLRAPTPTGAAEMAVPHIDELFEKILTNQSRLIRVMKEKLHLEKERLNRFLKSYAFRYPKQIYEQKLEQVDKLSEKLSGSMAKLYRMKEDEHKVLRGRLVRAHPYRLFSESLSRQKQLSKDLNRVMTAVFVKKAGDFRQKVAALEALNPLKVMSRGYSLVYNQEGKLVKSVEKVRKHDRLQVLMSDGALFCHVTDIERKKDL